MCVHVEHKQITDVRFLPIVSCYAERIGLVERIDQLLDCQMEVSPGRIVLAMILDALSGTSPLFRIGEFAADDFLVELHDVEFRQLRLVLTWP